MAIVQSQSAIKRPHGNTKGYHPIPVNPEIQKMKDAIRAGVMTVSMDKRRNRAQKRELGIPTFKKTQTLKLPSSLKLSQRYRPKV